LPLGPAHIPVLLAEVVAALDPRAGETYLDCTAGLGGHAAAIAAVMDPDASGQPATIILNDADPANLEVAQHEVRVHSPRTILHALRGNFAELPHKLPALLGEGRVNLLMADLGIASPQIDDPSRGFSFSKDGPLDMRMDPSLPVSAADMVNGYPEEQLAGIIERYGEDRNARRIARKLVQSRSPDPILTTGRLAELVRAASSGGRKQGIDPATRTFQALRIAVNDELGSLEALLEAVVREAELLASKKSASWLASGARVAVISFHSLEDRPVKQAMERLISLGATDLTGGAKTATDEEVQANPRARSAKLRAVRLPG
jgi:16S rRNA (cytosine1402-N4)-methyltransferase